MKSFFKQNRKTPTDKTWNKKFKLEDHQIRQKQTYQAVCNAKEIKQMKLETKQWKVTQIDARNNQRQIEFNRTTNLKVDKRPPPRTHISIALSTFADSSPQLNESLTIIQLTSQSESVIDSSQIVASQSEKSTKLLWARNWNRRNLRFTPLKERLISRVLDRFKPNKKFYVFVFVCSFEWRIIRPNPSEHGREKCPDTIIFENSDFCTNQATTFVLLDQMRWILSWPIRYRKAHLLNHTCPHIHALTQKLLGRTRIFTSKTRHFYRQPP